MKFYLVSILFIIFDLEIAFLFPWAVSLKNIGALGFYSMMFFIYINSWIYLSMEEWSFRLGINIEHNSSLNIDKVFEKKVLLLLHLKI